LTCFLKIFKIWNKLEKLLEEDKVNIFFKLRPALEKFKQVTSYRTIRNSLLLKLKINDSDKTKFFKDFFNKRIITPLSEELFYRGLIQDFFLNHLTKQILDTAFLNHPIYRCLRITVSSILFAISHENGDFLNTFLSGIRLGVSYDYGGYKASVITHFGHNFSVFLSRLTE
jgi:hypothetical protein